MLSFDSNEDVNKIHGIRSILGSIIKVEPVKNSPLIPQCKKCQSFGHTKNYCSNTVRCVKCAGKHDTANCTLEKSEPPKCCNCGERHPANYRGCAVAKELQKLRDHRKKVLNPNANQRRSRPTETILPETTSTDGRPELTRTFADVARAGNRSDTDVFTLIKTMMKQQEAFNKQLELRLAKIETHLNV